MQKPAGASLMDAFPEPPYHLLVITPFSNFNVLFDLHTLLSLKIEQRANSLCLIGLNTYKIELQET
jgi:hypothetical protein